MKGFYLIHAVAHCSDCKWEDTDYRTAITTAREHAKKTGHTVEVETGYCKTYNPKKDIK